MMYTPGEGQPVIKIQFEAEVSQGERSSIHAAADALEAAAAALRTRGALYAPAGELDLPDGQAAYLITAAEFAR